MSGSLLASPRWLLALSLEERRRALADGDRAPPDPEAAAERFARWRAHRAFTSDEDFARRLEGERLSEPVLRRLLGERAGEVTVRLAADPPWIGELCRAFAASPSAPSLRPPPALAGHAIAPFLAALEPLAAPARARLRDGAEAIVRAHPGAPFDPAAAVSILWPAACELLLRRTGRTFALELHAARLLGELDGATPEARFASFVRQLERPERMLALLHEYPVLARAVCEQLERWLTTGLELLAHLAADAGEIARSLAGGAALGALAQVASSGDTHRGGRSVRVLRFDSGIELIYKPRPLGAEVHFQALLAWLNQHGDHPPFRILRVLPRGDHGWVERVVAAPCDDEAEVARFYQRLGGLLAVVRTLGGIDMHHENLLAAGEQPVLVDLEGLFHPDLLRRDQPEADWPEHRAIADSVLMVGLLPWRVWADEEREGIDVGGVAQMAGQRSAFPVPRWRGAGTDELRLERAHEPTRADHNSPVLRGRPVDPLAHVDDVAAGFSRLYRLLAERRAELGADGGPLDAFADDEVRVIPRSTTSYSNLLQESYHPEALRDALERDRMWDLLWAPAGRRPSLGRLVPHERADLHAGDVPLFSARPAASHLWDSRGERIDDFFDPPGLTRARRVAAKLGEHDHARQLWHIHASFATTRPDAKTDRAARRSPQRADGARPAEPSRCLAAARAIGDRLAALALRGEGDASWIGLVIRERGRPMIEPLNLDLYDGLPGVALFLARLGEVAGDGAASSLARDAVRAIRKQLGLALYRPRLIGMLVGWGGMLYAWAHLGALWSDESLLDEAEGFIPAIAPMLEQDRLLDVSGGAAGAILGLLALDHVRPSAAARALAVQCGDRLLALAREMDEGIGWSLPPVAELPLTGFAHGNAGFARALAALAQRTGEARFADAARSALQHERSQFLPELGNWPDLRVVVLSAAPGPGAPPRCRTSWCHGAPGIGVARLSLLDRLDDQGLRGEIEAALATTRAEGFGDNHSLCHGDLGNLELFLLAGERLGLAAWREQAYRQAALVLDEIEAGGVRCGVPMQIETPGLFTGLAGIGYGLLRLGAPDCVPSLLALDDPRS